MAGCADPASPTGPAALTAPGVYVLVSPLPAAQLLTPSNEVWVESDTLELRPDGSFRDTNGQRIVNSNWGADRHEWRRSATASGVWTLRGTELTLTYGPETNDLGDALVVGPGPVAGPLTPTGQLTQPRRSQTGPVPYTWTRR